ncbi:MAG: SPFH domain-containing protein [bacterium]|nr:SPFH domain-containing protein [bacterium]
MGIIRATMQAIGKSLADQWLEVVEADDMGDSTLFAAGVKVRKGQNVKGSDNVISDGSVIHVYPNQFMILVDGGKVVDYCAEEGYFEVDSSSPSLFNGSFGEALAETFERVKYGGVTPKKQQVYFINLQEIKGIKFGTPSPVNYFDNFYNAELFLRAHGTYSIKVNDPLKFYAEVVPKNVDRVEIEEINEQYRNEFLEALQSAINQMSADGIRISYVSSKGRELSRYMAEVLDEEWSQRRGIEIESVGIASLTYDDASQKLIHMRNEGAMLSDPSVREGYVQGAVARGMEAAGSNRNGAMSGFMGMGMGMQTAGNFMGTASATNMQQMQMRQAQAAEREEKAGWTCSCGAINTGKFCSECGKPKPQVVGSWQCSCGAVNTGRFCSECGKPKPQVVGSWQCSCGAVNTGRFCSECGKPKPQVGGSWQCSCGAVNTGRFCSECGKPRG